MPTEPMPQTLDAADVARATGLMGAAKAGDLDKLQAWLEAGADVNAVDHLGKTALMHAADGHTQDVAGLVSLLIAFGADIDAADGFGNSAAMRAALAGRWALVDLLEALGADMLLGNCYGISVDDVRRFAWEEDSDSEWYEESAPPLVVPGRPLEDSVFAPAGAEHDAGYCWHAADDVLNQAFDASRLADAAGALPPHPLAADGVQEAMRCDSPSAADAVGLHFASH